MGVVKFVPVANAVPPEGTLYHVTVPPEAVAVKVITPESHTLAGVVAVMVGVVFTVAITGVLGEVQLPVEAST